MDELRALINSVSKKKKEFPFSDFSLYKRPKKNKLIPDDIDKLAKESDLDPEDLFSFIKKNNIK
jgi:hypothetical protein